ncbi:1-phosphofructokinase [Salsuginibacillus kocurii]|uniref:1-phosphofructokinase n=1 Tax=Salsuginibacillus kocurii TaxID=427078 RepID=UPI0003708B64|nr:1-phosphofructokinase [Salsuginibacillus kocurii]
MIYTVTLNPAIDYMVKMSELQAGHVNRAQEDLKTPGGKGINVSTVLNQLGLQNKAFGFAGGFTGRYLQEELQKRSIDTDFTEIEADTRINMKIKADEETEINGPAPHIKPAEEEALLSKLEGLGPADTVVLSGSVPGSLSTDIYKSILTKVHRKQVHTILDTSGEPFEKALEASPHFIKPNHHELGELYNIQLNHEKDIYHYAQKLQQDYSIPTVLVSMAGAGALLIDHEQAYRAYPPAGTVKNSVGAGDSMVAGFLAAKQSDNDPAEALKLAIAAGSATAFSERLGTHEEIESLKQNVKTDSMIIG